jgi:NAD(P)H-dependent flavin oxidoreductase YrpB (nitropropane dioxygenase family)
MNHVSDLRLIRAAAAAGITPGIVLGLITDAELEDYLQDYYETNVILTLPITALMTDIGRYVDMGVRYVEVLRYYDLTPDNEDQISVAVNRLQQRGVKVILRGGLEHKNLKLPFDAYVIKGAEGAGGSNRDIKPLKNTYDYFKTLLPNVIPTGGIHSAEQVKYYLDQGAIAVAIGTLFAMSQECQLSAVTKEQLLQTSSADLTRFGRHGKQGIVHKIIDSDDENNHTLGLQRGIKDLCDGHVYCGTAIDHITSIRPIQDIVDDLIRLL